MQGSTRSAGYGPATTAYVGFVREPLRSEDRVARLGGLDVAQVEVVVARLRLAERARGVAVAEDEQTFPRCTLADQRDAQPERVGGLRLVGIAVGRLHGHDGGRVPATTPTNAATRGARRPALIGSPAPSPCQ